MYNFNKHLCVITVRANEASRLYPVYVATYKNLKIVNHMDAMPFNKFSFNHVFNHILDKY